LNDNAESGLGNWTVSTGWAWNTAQFHSPTHSFGYSPYPANANGSLTLTVPLNITLTPVCLLSFWQRYDLESGYDFGNIEVSSDNGTSWQLVAAFTGTNFTWTQQTYDITNFANGSSQVKVRFRLSSDPSLQNTGWWVDDVTITNYCGSLVGISGNDPVLPNTFALGQNYPNPFNPATVIKYQLPKSSNVKIRVFDILGKEVATLVNEKIEAGYHQVEFNGGDLASGLYLYKIEADGFTDVKKMMLIK